jgi:tryptophan synthase alpha chain
MSDRIAKQFARIRAEQRTGLVIYLTAGDPSLDFTARLVPALAAAGADVIELGVPFSDPMADGPVIQRASERALRGGATPGKVLEAVREIRRQTSVPLILFSYFNPVRQMGLELFAGKCAEAGADGALMTDLPPEEAGEYCAAMRRQNLDTIFLAAPTSTDARLKRIAGCSTGFLYLVSRTGVTGPQEEISADVLPLVERVRKVSALPLAVGFGISRPEHLLELGGMAEAVVIGSAVVERIESGAGPDSGEPRPHRGERAMSRGVEFVRELREAATAAGTRRHRASPMRVNGP